MRFRLPVRTRALSVFLVLALGSTLGLAIPGHTSAPEQAGACSHEWRLSELYSNADGTIQFIELHNPTMDFNEWFLATKWIRSDTTGFQFDIPADVTGDTGLRYMLFGTATFAALPGAPTPDYIIPDNFFSTDGDLIDWFFYDSVTTLPNDIPTSGGLSYNQDHVTETWSTGVNSPTNYNGDTGSVAEFDPTMIEFIRGDADQSGTITINDAIVLLGHVFQETPNSCTNALDVDDDGMLTIGDAIQQLQLSAGLGSPPSAPYPACGIDPTTDGPLYCISHGMCP